MCSHSTRDMAANQFVGSQHNNIDAQHWCLFRCAQLRERGTGSSLIFSDRDCRVAAVLQSADPIVRDCRQKNISESRVCFFFPQNLKAGRLCGLVQFGDGRRVSQRWLEGDGAQAGVPVPRKFVPPLRGSKQLKKNLNCGSYPGLPAWARLCRPYGADA